MLPKLPEAGRIVTAWDMLTQRYRTGIVQHWHNHDQRGFVLFSDTGARITSMYDDAEWKYVDEPKGGVIG